MDNNCQLVVFSDKAYNAVIRETFEWDPVETGGILLGHVLDNGCWIVMEVLPPGYGEGREGDNVFHEYGYFEYNRKFVNYLAKSVAEQYEIPLELLGLWHRHPGNMDYFSGTDDGTNSTFAMQNPHGVISGLVNVDPQLRLTMYYLSHRDARTHGRPNYQTVDVEVGSDLIPEEYFKLRYVHGEERDLHPYAPQREDRKRDSRHNHVENLPIDSKDIIARQMARNGYDREYPERDGRSEKQHLSVAEDLIEKIKKNKTIIILLLATIALLFSLSKIDFSKCMRFFDSEDKNLKEEVVDTGKKETDIDTLKTKEQKSSDQGKTSEKEKSEDKILKQTKEQ